MFTMFREGGKDSPFSIRRILAFLLSSSAVYLFAISGGSINLVYGGGACLLSSVLLLFFTTWGDVAKVAAAIKGEK